MFQVSLRNSKAVTVQQEHDFIFRLPEIRLRNIGRQHADKLH